MDAVEYLTDELKAEMMTKIPNLSDDVTACSIVLRHVFMGRILRRGMPVYRQMRLFVYVQLNSKQGLWTNISN